MDSIKFKIALVGCGRISKNHIRAIIENFDKFELIAICDNSKIKLKTAIELIKKEYEKYNLNYKKPKEYSEYNELLNAHLKSEIFIDLIVLATPSGLHSNQTILAGNKGINVCTEKPMAIDLDEAKKMIRICKLNKVKLFVVKQNRLNSTLQDLKKRIEDNMFGDIALVNVNVFWHRPQSYYDQDEWRGTLSLDGGALMNQAIHYIDLLEWLIGPVKSIFSYKATRNRDIEAEDTAVIAIEWDKGVIGTMAVTMVTYPKNLEGSITIIGSNGSAKVGGVALNKYEYFYFDEEYNENEILSKNYDPKNVYGSGHNEYYKNISESLLNKANPICSGEEGLSSLKMVIGAYKSAQEKKLIYLEDL